MELNKLGIETVKTVLEFEPGRGLFGSTAIHICRVSFIKKQTTPIPWNWVVTDTTEYWLLGANNPPNQPYVVDDKPIDKDLREEVVNYLDKEIPKYDLVIVADFGHGFIDDTIKRKLEEKSKFLALNVQSNSSNLGYNYFNLYEKSDFISMNEQEMRLPLLKRFEELDEIIKEMHNKFRHNNVLITKGNEGVIFVNKGTTASGSSFYLLCVVGFIFFGKVGTRQERTRDAGR